MADWAVFGEGVFFEGLLDVGPGAALKGVGLVARYTHTIQGRAATSLQFALSWPYPRQSAVVSVTRKGFSSSSILTRRR